MIQLHLIKIDIFIIYFIIFSCDNCHLFFKFFSPKMHTKIFFLIVLASKNYLPILSLVRLDFIRTALFSQNIFHVWMDGKASHTIILNSEKISKSYLSINLSQLISLISCSTRFDFKATWYGYIDWRSFVRIRFLFIMKYCQQLNWST